MNSTRESLGSQLLRTKNRQSRISDTVCRMKLLLLLIFSIFYYSSANGSDSPFVITVAPVNTVGCYGGSSTFYCESDRINIIHIGWLINGDTITNETIELRGILITNEGNSVTLSIIGSKDNNGITIGCVVSIWPPPVTETSTALFTVSDIPPVTNLTITFTNNGTIMNCTWIQPSCLPVNYWYSISINNVTVTNTTSTVYSISNIESCTNYTVSVTVTDGQYQSIPTIETARTRISEDFGVSLRTSCVDFFDDLYRSVKIEFQASEQYRSHLYHVFYNCSEDVYDNIVSLEYSESTKINVNDLLVSYNESTGIGNYTIGPFNGSFIGNYTLQTQDEEIARTRISTFNVQNATISQTSNGSTMMECVFAYNSPADGCLLELVSQTTGIVTSRNITKDKNEGTATLYTDLDIPEGEYDVHVYDIVEGKATTESAAVDTSYYHLQHIVKNTSFTTVSSVSTGSSSMSIPITPSMSSNTENDNIAYIGVASSLAGVVLVVIAIVVVICVVCTCIQRYRMKFQHILNGDIELAMVELPPAPSNDDEAPEPRMTTSKPPVSISDNTSVDYMEDVLNVINFDNTTSGPTHTEPVLPSINTSLESDSELSQIVIPSTDTGSEMEFEQMDNTGKRINDDYLEYLYDDDSCVGQSVSSGSYLSESSPDQDGSKAEYFQSEVVVPITSVHGHSILQYAQIDLYLSNSDSTHHPITRQSELLPVYAIVHPTKKDLPTKEDEEQLGEEQLGGEELLVIGLTPVKNLSERFEYMERVIASYQEDNSICVPGVLTIACGHDNDTLLPDTHGYSTQSGSPIASPHNNTSVLISIFTNGENEFGDERMPSSTEVVRVGSLYIPSNEAVHEKNASCKNLKETENGAFAIDKRKTTTDIKLIEQVAIGSCQNEEALNIDGRKATEGLNEQAVMPAISPHQNDNDEDSTHG